jgi:uncharacterized damage-inducible protein DinB
MGMSFYDAKALDGMHSEVGLFAASLIDSTREWRGELGEPTDEAIVWQPFANGYSIGTQLLHLAGVEKWWIHCACGGREFTASDKKRFQWEETDVDACIWPEAPNEPFSWYDAILKEVRAESLAIMAELDDPERIFQRKGSENTLTIRWILGHTLQHDSYHGGQAVLLKTLWERTQ